MFENWLTWVIMAVLLFIVEMGSPSAFFFVCLGVGALLASVTTLFHVFWLNWAVFFGGSILAIVISRPLINRLSKGSPRRANVDALIDQTAVVIEEIKPTKFGRVKFEGEEWLAESHEEIPKDSHVKITGVKGVRLTVKSISAEPSRNKTQN